MGRGCGQKVGGAGQPPGRLTDASASFEGSSRRVAVGKKTLFTAVPPSPAVILGCDTQIVTHVRGRPLQRQQQRKSWRRPRSLSVISLKEVCPHHRPPVEAASGCMRCRPFRSRDATGLTPRTAAPSARSAQALAHSGSLRRLLFVLRNAA